MIVGASDLGEGNLGASTGNLEDGTEFALLARYGYGGRLTFSESAREAHRRAGLVVRNRCDNPIRGSSGATCANALLLAASRSGSDKNAVRRERRVERMIFSGL